VPARRREPVGDHAPDPPRAGPAPPVHAEQPDAALQGDDGSAQVPRRERLRRLREHRRLDVDEAVRVEELAHFHRYLMLRYKVTMEVRKFLDANGFIDIETPMLTKSTPEGARDYLVPSRV